MTQRELDAMRGLPETKPTSFNYAAYRALSLAAAKALETAQSRADALERVAYGVCSACVNNGESITDDNSPCFEYGLRERNGYFPRCEFWEFDETRLREDECNG